MLYYEKIYINYKSIKQYYGLQKSKYIIFSLKDFKQAIKNYNYIYFLIITPLKIKNKANIPLYFANFKISFQKKI